MKKDCLCMRADEYDEIIGIVANYIYQARSIAEIAEEKCLDDETNFDIGSVFGGIYSLCKLANDILLCLPNIDKVEKRESVKD